MVENYFSASGAFSSDPQGVPITEYWLGISRAGSANPYKYVSGQLISAVVSGAEVLRYTGTVWVHLCACLACCRDRC
jgi:hypothetical protein